MPVSPPRGMDFRNLNFLAFLLLLLLLFFLFCLCSSFGLGTNSESVEVIRVRGNGRVQSTCTRGMGCPNPRTVKTGSTPLLKPYMDGVQGSTCRELTYRASRLSQKRYVPTFFYYSTSVVLSLDTGNAPLGHLCAPPPGQDNSLFRRESTEYVP